MTMSKSLQKPTILNVETVARSRSLMSKASIWNSATVCVAFMNVCGLPREAVMIVPIVDDHHYFDSRICRWHGILRAWLFQRAD
jgi:ADP-ribose diphosphatase